MSTSRDRILERLRTRRDGPLSIDRAAVEQALAQPVRAATEPPSRQERIQMFTDTISRVQGQVIETSDQEWVSTLGALARQRDWGSLLLPATGDTLAHAVTQHWPTDATTRLVHYDRPVEDWSDRLFNDTDAALTSTRGAVAETGSLIVWPDAQQPRLMSLAPPVHIALLHADELYWTLTDALEAQPWSSRMPTNALLISGPSKTADIEQTLVYGAHGPKELIVLLCV